MQADWLITKDGERIETRGLWKVRGETVVFTNARDVLCSLRVKEVDLKASESATKAALHASESVTTIEQSERQVAKVVITEADVRHVRASGPSVVDSLRQAPRVILYSTSWCPYCKKARRLLSSQGVEFVEKDFEMDAAANREYLVKENGYKGIPLIQIGDQLLRGFNEEKILRALKNLDKVPAVGSSK